MADHDATLGGLPAFKAREGESTFDFAERLVGGLERDALHTGIAATPPVPGEDTSADLEHLREIVAELHHCRAVTWPYDGSAIQDAIDELTALRARVAATPPVHGEDAQSIELETRCAEMETIHTLKSRGDSVSMDAAHHIQRLRAMRDYYRENRDVRLRQRDELAARLAATESENANRRPAGGVRGILNTEPQPEPDYATLEIERLRERISRLEADNIGLIRKLATTEAEAAGLRESRDALAASYGELLALRQENADLLVQLAGGDALHRAIAVAREFLRANPETTGDDFSYLPKTTAIAWEHLKRIVAAAPVSPRDV